MTIIKHKLLSFDCVLQCISLTRLINAEHTSLYHSASYHSLCHVFLCHVCFDNVFCDKLQNEKPKQLLRTWRSGSSLDRKYFRKYDELETHGEKDTTPALIEEGFFQGAIYIRVNFNVLVE
jgi:hypothetical protein